MEGTELVDNIIKNIVTEVKRECKNRRIPVHTDFIAYYVQLLQLDPNRGLNTNNLTHREKIQSFIRFVVSQVGRTHDPKIITLRLQYEFHSYFKELERAVNKYRNQMQEKVYPLLLEIVEQEHKNVGEKLYKKITYYVTLSSGLGNPAQKEVFKEALQVVKSVLTTEEVSMFPTLQNYIKQEFLKCLVDITTGIRLYNKACKRGGEGMNDLRFLLAKGIRAVKEGISKCMSRTVLRYKVLTIYIERHMTIVTEKEGNQTVILNFHTEVEKEHWRYIRDLAAAFRQLNKTNRILLEYLTNLDNNLKKLNEEYVTIIKALDKIIIPTLYQAINGIFPYFTKLSYIWNALQDDAIRLREVYRIFSSQSYQMFTMDYDVYVDSTYSSYIDYWVKTMDEADLLDVRSNLIKIHTDVSGFNREDLELHGYCCWVLINTDGALVPGNLSLGVVEYKHKNYIFSSKMAANCFIRNPEEHIMKTYQLARERVHLIIFLNLKKELKDHIHINTLIQPKEEEKIYIEEKGVQTDTHFQTSNHDRTYKWNVWDIRRQNLKLLDIMGKTTGSTETANTYKKENHQTQTYDLKDSDTQTKTDNCANTVRSVRYFYGLRGKKENRPFMMDLKTDKL